MYSTIITHFGDRPYHPILTESVLSLTVIEQAQLHLHFRIKVTLDWKYG